MSILEATLPDTKTDAMIPRWFRVDRVRRETRDTFTLDLALPENEDAFRFEPGQFNMLYVFGVGEVPISISGDPERRDEVLHTVRAVGTVTRAMQRLRRGDVVGLRGPFGTAWPVEQATARDIVIVTGGIGLAPLRPAMYTILNNRDRYRHVTLLYGSRTPDDILYADEIRKWRSRLDLFVDVTVDRAVGRWRGNVGVVPTLVKRAPIDPDCVTALVCGPEVMMRYTIEALEKSGVAKRDIYISMERNMKCGVGLCGHCQFGPHFICKDGPVLRFDRIERLFSIREV